MSYYPVALQQLMPVAETWMTIKTLHAIQVNKTGGGESFNAGADQYHPTLTFIFRWCPTLEAVAYSPQTYRLLYRGHLFDIQDYDDYMERHLDVKLTGVAYA